MPPITHSSPINHTACFKTILGLREWNKEMSGREAAGVAAMKKWGKKEKQEGLLGF